MVIVKIASSAGRGLARKRPLKNEGPYIIKN